MLFKILFSIQTVKNHNNFKLSWLLAYCPLEVLYAELWHFPFFVSKVGVRVILYPLCLLSSLSLSHFVNSYVLDPRKRASGYIGLHWLSPSPYQLWEVATQLTISDLLFSIFCSTSETNAEDRNHMSFSTCYHFDSFKGVSGKATDTQWHV